MTPNELKKELVISYLKKLHETSSKNPKLRKLLLTVLEDFRANNLCDDIRVHPMNEFDEVIGRTDLTPSGIARLATDRDLTREYFVYDYDSRDFMSFDYSEIIRVFDLNCIADDYIDSEEIAPNETIKAIQELDVTELRNRLFATIIKYCEDAELVEAFNEYAVEEQEPSVQLFKMDDLDDIFFEFLHDNDTTAAVRALEKYIKSGNFTTNDLYWEMDENGDIYSFSSLLHSHNFTEYLGSYLDWLILERDFSDFRNPSDLGERLDDLLSAYLNF